MKSLFKQRQAKPKQMSYPYYFLLAYIVQPCRVAASHKRFQHMIVISVFLNSVCICLRDPLGDPNGLYNKTIDCTNLFLIFLFSVELLINIIGLTAFSGEKAYFHDPWNCLDFLIIFLSSLCASYTLVTSHSPANLQSFVRTVQPLRVIKQFEAMKHVANIVLSSLPSVASVGLICGLFFLMFSVFAVSILKGTLGFCDGLMTKSQLALLTYPRSWDTLSQTQKSWFLNSTCYESSMFPVAPTSKDICDCWFENAWTNVLAFPSGFDNVLKGFYTFMKIATGSGWNDVMVAATNQRGINMQPVENASMLWVLFFCTMSLFSNLFLLTFFAGAITGFYSKVQTVEGRNSMAFSTTRQLNLLEKSLLIKPMKHMRAVPSPNNRFLKICFRIVGGEQKLSKNNKKTQFDTFSSLIILLNCIALALPFFGQGNVFDSAEQMLLLIFTLLFNIETLLRLLGLRKYFFRQPWNIFDLLVVCATNAVLMVNQFGNSVTGKYATSFGRIMRLLRIVQVAKSLKGAESLILSLLSSLAGLLNVAGLVFVILGVFSVGAMELFAKVSSSQLLHVEANFQSIRESLVSLIWLATGDNWNEYVQRLEQSPPGCDESPAYNSYWCEITNNAPGCIPLNGCSSKYTIFFFLFFKMVVTYTMANLFIGTIMDALASPQSRMKAKLITQKVIEDYNALWMEQDPLLTNLYPAYLFPQFLRALQEPLGLPERDRSDPEKIRAFINSLNLPNNIIMEGLHYLDYDRVTIALSDAMLQRGNLHVDEIHFNEVPNEKRNF